MIARVGLNEGVGNTGIDDDGKVADEKLGGGVAGWPLIGVTSTTPIRRAATAAAWNARHPRVTARPRP